MHEKIDTIWEQPSSKLFFRARTESVAPLVIITGSGLSKPAGFPDWKALKRIIELEIRNKQKVEEKINPNHNPYIYKDVLSETDYWLFFNKSSNILTKATFNGVVRNALDRSEYTIPASYKSLLSLDPRGFVTLNLDRIAGEAVAQHFSGININSIYGFDLQTRWKALNEEQPFLVYLHGHISSPDSWVLTSDQLKALTSNSARDIFLSKLYLEYNVLFVGLSADDLALSSQILKLKDNKFDLPRLFWLTSRMDAPSTSWASENGVQKIMYSASTDAEHESAIISFCNAAKSFQSIDDRKPAPKIDHRKLNIGAIASRDPNVIANFSPEEARLCISNLLVERLNGLEGDLLYDSFEKFVDEFRYPIMSRSFYRDQHDGMNVFFGYKLRFPSLGKGNFGEVFQAEDTNGNIVALKIMHNNIVENREMIGGFRRGVRSMDILTKGNIGGVVKYIESFEMPPVIVMESVCGNSIEEYFSDISKLNWFTKIKIVNDIANIVDCCHKHPNMVLHRDIKPSNIMLAGLDFVDGSYGDIFVLDFDMSWHKGSSEKDVVFESRDDFGYLAPEQTVHSGAFSARSAKVDSYGLAMTAFAIFGGRHPAAGAPLSEKWLGEILYATGHGYSCRALSLRNRLSRALFDGTRYSQQDRLEFDVLAGRITKICKAVVGNIYDLDVFAEEILYRLCGSGDYFWDDYNDCGHKAFVNGLKLTIKVQSNLEYLEVGIVYEDRGSSQYKNRNELIGRAKDLFERMSKINDIEIINNSVNHGMLRFISRKKISGIDLEDFYRFYSDGIDILRRIE